jgi:hypothetical protein
MLISREVIFLVLLAHIKLVHPLIANLNGRKCHATSNVLMNHEKTNLVNIGCAEII